MDQDSTADWHHVALSVGLNLHIHATKRFKTIRIDLFLPTLLRPQHNTRLALIGRLAERGTQRYPDLISLNRYVDNLYGATYSATVENCGIYQLLHLAWECLDDRFTLGGESLWPRGVAFFQEVLFAPAGPPGRFRQTDLDQEKAALGQYIQALDNDKSGYAFRRCREMLCRDEPAALPANGCVADFSGIFAHELWQLQQDLAHTNPIEIFINGALEPAAAVEVVAGMFAGRKSRRPFQPACKIGQCLPFTCEAWEDQDLVQGRLALGGHTGVGPADPDYAALILLNALLGGDSYSALFRRVREEAGLAYHVQSFLEPLNGVYFIETACSQQDYGKTRRLIEASMADLQARPVQPEQMARAAQSLIQDVEALDDSREGLMNYGLRQRLTGTHISRTQLIKQINKVTPAQIQTLAARLGLEAVYFLK